MSWYRSENNFKKYNFTLVYLNRTIEDIAYKAELSEYEKLGLKVINVISNSDEVIKVNDCGLGVTEYGIFNQEIISKYNLASSQNNYFVSGPPGLVGSCKTMLTNDGIKSKNIHTDFFPGY
jgi:NAD(P)H-flavin reductase